MLSAIYIKGFKTFARPVRMPLGVGMTVIVGPNGSGKSNITDAVLFALGEGSPALLRAGSMAELIFSGSDSLSAVQAAEVTLVLSNARDDISLPYHEVSLTRRISRSGETEYRINGDRARLADVRAVAGEAGLGRHSILRQGAVDTIVAGGAAACRAALEEAAGLGVFRRRRLVAARKLERAVAQLESSRQFEAELSEQLRRIEAEAEAAREYRELEAHYRNLTLAHLYRVTTQELNERRENLETLTAKMTTLQTRQESLCEERRRLGVEEKELEDRILAAERILGGLEHGLEALQNEILRAERAFFRLEGAREREVEGSRHIFHLEAEFGKASSSVRRLEDEVSKLEREHSQRKRASGWLERLAARSRAHHAASARQLTRLSGELEVLREKRERTTARIGEADILDDEQLLRLGELVEKLSLYAPEGLHTRSTEVLRRLEELHERAVGLEVEANHRRGILAALIGRTEAEIQILRASGQTTADGKRLREIVRPHPGYEAAVDAALGDLASGVLVQTLGEGTKLLSGENPTERVVVRLDAEEVPKNGTPPGKALLDCVEILDTYYAGALKRLLGGTYVLEKDDHVALKAGYDVAVTRDGLRFTRTSASRRTLDGDFVRQAHLASQEQRLDVLKNRLGERLYYWQETVIFVNGRLSKQMAEVEAFVTVASRAARVMRLLTSETKHRAKKAYKTREQRSADEADLRRTEARIFAAEDALHGARDAEERTKQELDAALLEAESTYMAVERIAGRLSHLRTDLQRARERREGFTRGLKDLEEAATNGVNAFLVSFASRTAEHARHLEATVRERTRCLRNSRSDAAKLQLRVAEKRAELAGESGSVAGELAEVTSDAAALRKEISCAEEARKAAESEIFDEWGATLESAREVAEAFTEPSDDERGRLARKLQNFGDVNLLAIGQEGRLRERYELVAAQRADAEAAAEEIRRIILGVDREVEARFEATFREVRQAFVDMVPRMMEGAAGELGLSEEGVEIGLRLKRRGWKPLRMLSGGERSLLALSFLFSIFLGRSGGGPRAFCMLDEAEAALDDVNLARFLAVVDCYRADGQFLLVTHQKRTMAAADVLYGVAQDIAGASVVVSKRLMGE
ncbi:MAG: AAA family ATPase [Rubrobacter sp.]|nr:AAA family ATPase [Rubrobacter sp.]